LTTVKWASGSGKPFLGEDRLHSGVSPTVEVKRPDTADNAGVDDLNDNNDEEKPNQTKPGTPSEPVAPKPQPEDVQMKKALELLRANPASGQRGA
jgi:hypothetical protein